jgi:hypothetical protein
VGRWTPRAPLVLRVLVCELLHVCQNLSRSKPWMAAYWGRACCLPCEALSALCDGCGRACDAVCARCDCAQCCCPPGRPSPVFLSYTLLIAGLPQTIAMVAGLVALRQSCDQQLQLFLILNVRTPPLLETLLPAQPIHRAHSLSLGCVQGVLGVFWSVFAIHLYAQFSKPYTIDAGTLSDSTPMSRSVRRSYIYMINILTLIGSVLKCEQRVGRPVCLLSASG